MILLKYKKFYYPHFHNFLYILLCKYIVLVDGDGKKISFFQGALISKNVRSTGLDYIYYLKNYTSNYLFIEFFG